jgi:hypothetical protein
LLVIDVETGKTITSHDIDNDTDDIFYDSASKLIYISCGGGFLDIFKQIDPDRYDLVSKIETLTGARTSLFIPELNRLIIAAPASLKREAQVLIFEKQ